MGKPLTLATLIVSALCFSTLLGLAHGGNDNFNVQGKIYCDPCRLQHQTRSSIPLKGVKVILQCKTSKDGSVTYSNSGSTDQYGKYNISMNASHKNDYCEVTTDQSTHADCKETMTVKGDRVVVIMDVTDSSSSTRYAIPLGFMTKEIDPRCHLMVKEYDLFKE